MEKKNDKNDTKLTVGQLNGRENSFNLHKYFVLHK